MRPAEYRDYLLDLLKNTPDVQRVQVWEDGPYPYALIVSVGGREQRWQVVGQLADGAKHETPTAAASASGAPDAWLASVIGGAEPVDTERIEVLSVREGSSQTGVTVFFRNGERAFLRLA
jgi:hypothetical protein